MKSQLKGIWLVLSVLTSLSVLAVGCGQSPQPSTIGALPTASPKPRATPVPSSTPLLKPASTPPSAAQTQTTAGSGLSHSDWVTGCQSQMNSGPWTVTALSFQATTYTLTTQQFGDSACKTLSLTIVLQGSYQVSSGNQLVSIEASSSATAGDQAGVGFLNSGALGAFPTEVAVGRAVQLPLGSSAPGSFSSVFQLSDETLVIQSTGDQGQTSMTYQRKN